MLLEAGQRNLGIAVAGRNSQGDHYYEEAGFDSLDVGFVVERNLQRNRRYFFPGLVIDGRHPRKGYLDSRCCFFGELVAAAGGIV